MRTDQKRNPAYTDEDIMPWGKYEGRKLKDVPASYLVWLYDRRPLQSVKLQNYIWNSQDALRMEIEGK